QHGAAPSTDNDADGDEDDEDDDDDDDDEENDSAGKAAKNQHFKGPRFVRATAIPGFNQKFREFFAPVLKDFMPRPLSNIPVNGAADSWAREVVTNTLQQAWRVVTVILK